MRATLGLLTVVVIVVFLAWNSYSSVEPPNQGGEARGSGAGLVDSLRGGDIGAGERIPVQRDTIVRVVLVGSSEPGGAAVSCYDADRRLLWRDRVASEIVKSVPPNRQVTIRLGESNLIPKIHKTVGTRN